MSSLAGRASSFRAVAERLRSLAMALAGWPWAETARTLRQRFVDDRLGVTAASLTFTTLIALVPLLTVMLAVFTAFPIFGSFQGALEKFLLQHLVPDSIARPVMRSLTLFAGKARGLGSAGLLLLMATAVAMMLTIDRTLNTVWRVRRPRPLAQRVLVYWAGLTLGPLVLGASLSVTSYAISASRGFVPRALPGGVNLLFDVAQFGLLGLTLAAMYRFVPNTSVRWSHAAAGAAFAAVAFEVAKRSLAWYVDSIGSYSAIYGAFATLPILLLWIYASWLIVLFGAVVAAHAPSLAMRLPRRADAPGQRYTLALALLAELDRARRGAHRGLTLPQLSERTATDPLQIEPVLDVLTGFGWVGRLDEPGLARLVLLGELSALPASRLVDALLLAPGPLADPLTRRLAVDAVTVADLVGTT